MAIAARGTPTTATAPSGSNLVVTLPSGVVSGDFIIIDVFIGLSGSLPATPSGLTLLDSGTLGPRAATYYRVCDGTEPASYTFSTSGLANAANATCRAYSGVDNSSPINAHGALNRTTTSTFTASSITTTVDGCEIVYIAGSGTLKDLNAAPSGFSNKAFINSNTITAASWDEAQGTAGTIAATSGTWTTTANSYAGMIGLAPAAAGSTKSITPTTISATSILSGLVAALRKIAGAVSATSTITGGVAARRAVSPTIVSATSTVSGSVGVRRRVAPTTIAATSAIGGSVVAGRRIQPTAVSAISTVSGNLVVTRAIKPTQINAASSVDGSLHRIVHASGAITATSTVSGSIVRLLTVSGVIDAASTVSGSLERVVLIHTPNILATSTLTATFRSRHAGFIYYYPSRGTVDKVKTGRVEKIS